MSAVFIGASFCGCVVLAGSVLLGGCAHAPQQSASADKPNQTTLPEMTMDSIKFNTEGWQSVQLTDDRQSWQNNSREEISLHCNQNPPDLPCPLSYLAGLRNYYRLCADRSGAGLVSCDPIAIKGISCLKVICKVPQQPSGMAYVGTIVMPFSQGSYTIKVQSQERGITGQRESFILDKMMSKGLVGVDERSGKLTNWEKDPYDPHIHTRVMVNPSEAERYDSAFPAHPLSRVRRILTGILMSMEVSDDLTRLVPFMGPLPDGALNAQPEASAASTGATATGAPNKLEAPANK